VRCQICRLSRFPLDVFPAQTSCNDPILYHYCDTTEGDSGSPMWELGGISGDSSSMDEPPSKTEAHELRGPFNYITAVHNIEWDNEPAGVSEGVPVPVPVINSAVAITPTHYATILTWVSKSFNPGTDLTAGDPFSPSWPVDMAMRHVSSQPNGGSGQGVGFREAQAASPSAVPKNAGRRLSPQWWSLKIR